MQKWLSSLFLIFPLSLVAENLPADAVKKIHAHLLINDPLSAVKEAKLAIQLFPESKELHIALIRALSTTGDEIEVLEEWKTITTLFVEEQKNRNLLEMLAWGVLNKGEHSAQLPIRLNALIGASFTHDAKAIPLLIDELHSSNALLRSLAIKLAASYGDAPLKDELARLLKEEKVWYVRLEAIQAIGQLRMRSEQGYLQELIANPKTLAEEKATAIAALVGMYEKVEKEELRKLVRSDRAGLRQLACEMISYFDLKEEAEEIFPLLKDTSADVRLSALTALGLLDIEQCNGQPFLPQIEELINDPSPNVAITAAWVFLRQGSQKGKDAFIQWLKNEDSQLQRAAAAAIAVSGKNGIGIAEMMIKKSEDPYVRANLAIGLIGQREYIKLACATLYHVFINEKNIMWMWDNSVNTLFRSLAPSKIRHIDQIPHYPMVVDQSVRLEVLSILSIMNHSKAKEAMKSFLQNRNWGIISMASATLLQEGDEEALNMIKDLLQDPDEKIRFQAALILAVFGSDPIAIKVLQEVYYKLDREMKVHVLEAIAHIGDPESIPFLIDVLKEPFQVLRIIAASALIQCLYH